MNLADARWNSLQGWPGAGPGFRGCHRASTLGLKRFFPPYGKCQPCLRVSRRVDKHTAQVLEMPFQHEGDRRAVSEKSRDSVRLLDRFLIPLPSRRSATDDCHDCRGLGLIGHPLSARLAFAAPFAGRRRRDGKSLLGTRAFARRTEFGTRKKGCLGDRDRPQSDFFKRSQQDRCFERQKAAESNGR